MRRALIALSLSVIACSGRPLAGTRDHENWCYIQRSRGRTDPSCTRIFEAEAKQERARTLPKWCLEQAAMGNEPEECAKVFARSQAKQRAQAEAEEARQRAAAELEAQIREFSKTRPRAGCLMRVRNAYDKCMQGTDFLRLGNNPMTKAQAAVIEDSCARRLNLDAMVCNGLPETAEPPAIAPSSDGRKLNSGNK